MPWKLSSCRVVNWAISAWVLAETFRMRWPIRYTGRATSGNTKKVMQDRIQSIQNMAATSAITVTMSRPMLTTVSENRLRIALASLVKAEISRPVGVLWKNPRSARIRRANMVSWMSATERCPT